jgi:hypothetical protein
MSWNRETSASPPAANFAVIGPEKHQLSESPAPGPISFFMPRLRGARF